LETLAAFEVLEPGVLTTIQDLGRYGFGRFGVPLSGALDSFSLKVANLLVGNSEGEAGLEITITGLRLKALRETVISITGGDLTPFQNGEPLEMWRTHVFVEGDVITFKKMKTGCRAYLAVAGGISVSGIMGSRATCLSGRFGGLEGRPLKRGDTLYVSDGSLPLKNLGVRFPGEWIPDFQKEAGLKVIPGPQDDHFTEKGFETFHSFSYQITPHCDRTGVRLNGPRIERRADVEESIISEGLVPGAIQIPGDGKPIIILTELVTGGYAKIATVISAHLTKVAQLKPGDRVSFEPVLLEEAHHLLREEEEHLKNFAKFISG
jgi:antagonist of KipI